MKHIAYEDIPEVSGPPMARHGIFRKPTNDTLEIWVQGRLYAVVAGHLYDEFPDKRKILQAIADTLLRPLWEGTPWQRVLVKQLFTPWFGDGRWWTNETS